LSKVNLYYERAKAFSPVPMTVTVTALTTTKKAGNRMMAKLSSIRTKPKKNQRDTMVDFFLQGDQKENAAKLIEEGVVNFIPNPPGVLDPKSQKRRRKKQMKRVQELMKQYSEAQVKQALESKVQDYWKNYALWPASWPEMREALELQTAFAEQFRSFSLVNDLNGAGVMKADSVVARSFKTFVCAAPVQVGIRNSPTADNSEKNMTGAVLKPGQVVVAENVVVVHDERFLKLPSAVTDAKGDLHAGVGGWVPEFKNDMHIMAEITKVEIGLWWYRVACEEFIELRQVPTYSRRFGSGWIMCPGEVCVVSLRCNIANSTWLQLADGRGWVFTMKSQDAMEQNQVASPVVMEQADKASLHEDLKQFDLDGDGQIDDNELEQALQAGLDQTTMSAVESGLWQYQVLEKPILSTGNVLNGSMLQPNEVFAVDLRAPASGKKTKEVSAKAKNSQLDRIWLRLYDGRGWIPKVDTDGKPLVRFTGSGNAQKKKAPKDVPPKEPWMYGVA